MLSFILMIAFSLCVMLYGFSALFKPEWLMNVRAFSAKIEGKEAHKHDELSSNLSQARKVMAILALIVGILGLAVSIATLFIYFQAQAGPISL